MNAQVGAETGKSGAADFEVSIRVRADRMAVLLNCPKLPSDLELLLERVRTALKGLGIPEEWRGETCIERVRQAAAEAESIKNLIIVKGEPPEPPKDGRIEWGNDFFNSAFVVNEKTGAIDYRKRVAQTSVEAGQLLATVRPPVKGRAGRDVHGRAVAAKKGQWPIFRAGENIREDKEERKYFAAKTGRIRWRARTLSVDEVYVIQGNVGLGTGDIDHPGAVIVKGDIEPGATVKAAGNLEVRGIIDQADVETGGDLVVHRGIVGRGRAPLKVGGSVHAKFINEAELEADEDIVVEREIVQSIVKTRSAVTMRRGRLVGGETTALKGILVAQTGTEALVPTALTVGTDFRLQEEIDERVRQCYELEERREKIRRTVEPIASRGAKLTKESREAMKRLFEELKELGKRIEGLIAEVNRMKAEAKDNVQMRVEATKIIYPETMLSTPLSQYKVPDEFSGPAYANLVDGEIKLHHGQSPWEWEPSEPAV
ncbi:MAG TPA: DUF342 domain-containing protein [Candidatus Hydrogenedentes bacterium]|nr:DUF342 domain-containing protein [Candidatus Hydrogenedentota bacterium]